MKHSLIVSFLIYFLLLINSLHPQPPNIKFDHLTIDDGLSGNAIERWQSIMQDRNGFLWICTTNGLNKYDGYKFTIYKNDPTDPGSISSNWINSIFQDHTGTLWIGTGDRGLDRFNEANESFIHFRHDPSNENSISNNNIFSLAEDQEGDLWIGTANGISRLKRPVIDSLDGSNNFSNYSINLNNVYSRSDNFAYALYVDKFNTVWAGFQNDNLARYNRSKDEFEIMVKQEEQYDYWTPINRWEGLVKMIFQDPADHDSLLTIGANFGLYKYDLFNEKIIDAYRDVNTRLSSRLQDDIWGYTIDQKRRVWMGTAHDGLYITDPIKGDILHLESNPHNPEEISHNKVLCIYPDSQKIIWVGTYGGGLNKYDPLKYKFEYYQLPKGRTTYTITSVFEDRFTENILWLGTDDRTLLKYNIQTRGITPYTIKKTGLPYPLTCIFQDEKNKNLMWIGYLGFGFYTFDIQKEEFTFLNYPDVFRTREDIRNSEDVGIFLYVTNICRSASDKFWLSTLFGLHLYDTASGKYHSYLHTPEDPKSLSDNYVSALCKSNIGQGGEIWIGTRYGGLNRFDTVKNEFEHYRYDASDSTSINSDYISSVYEDKRGNLWIGTPVGLNLYNRDSNNFTRIADDKKMLSVEILGILEDNQGNLWLHTQGGLFRYNPITNYVRHYDKEDGLDLSFFYRFAYHRGKSGKIYIGGDGLISFHPDSIQENHYIPPVVLTDFQIYNKSIKPGIGSPLKQALHETREIKLSYEQSVFSFEFAALDFSSPQKNRYAYKMEGVDPEWVYRDAKRRYVTYTNLDPGEYLFQVKGSNNDGIWNEQPTSVKIIIMPPWWKSKVAYVFYGLFIIVLITVTWRVQVNRLHRQHQMELEHLEAEKLKEVDRIKSRFFTNISHEFRTPLTLIEGPIKQLLHTDVTEGLKDQYQLILRNTKRLMNLVNQLLDLSKLEAGRMKLLIRRQNIIPLFHGLIQTFESLARNQKITFTFASLQETIDAYIDEEKIEKISNNLLSNAFKFTPEGGKVEVDISCNGGRGRSRSAPATEIPSSVTITVTNTGPGITPGKIDNIFNRFYQADDSQTRHHEGTGIGLALVKEMVELHHGQIKVTSVPDNTTTFTITIPIDEESYDESEICQDDELGRPTITGNGISGSDDLMENEMVEMTRRVISTISPDYPVNHKPCVLIVDDNTDVRKYIGNILGAEYHILEAEDGEKGIEISCKKFPDLIISDVMMPGMDGFELCRRIKTDQVISHLPVILLTARAAAEDKLEGLGTGADDYITKPFDAVELRLRVTNILQQRKRLREKFCQDLYVKPKEITVTSHDEKLISDLMALIEKNLSDPDLDVSKICRESGLSRTHLNRKLRALVDLSVVEFIRLMRLRRAKDLLEKKFGNISEVAFEVGFNSVAYFSHCYLRQFGLNPSEVVNGNNKRKH